MALHPCPHCGHPISEKAEKCPGCHQDPRLTPEELALQNAAKKKKRKRTLLIVGICAAVVLIAGGTLAALFLPDYLDYRAACDLLDKRDYVAAAAAFDSMKDYRDSSQKALEARYQYVMFNKTRDDKQTRDYLHELVDAEYKDAARIEEQIYRWEITFISCGNTSGGFEKNIFSRQEPLYFYVEAHGGRIAEKRRLRYEATIYPSAYWQSLGAEVDTQSDDIGWFFDGDTTWFGWPDGIKADTVGSVTVSLYDSETNQLLKTCGVTIY